MNFLGEGSDRLALMDFRILRKDAANSSGLNDIGLTSARQHRGEVAFLTSPSSILCNEYIQPINHTKLNAQLPEELAWRLSSRRLCSVLEGHASNGLLRSFGCHDLIVLDEEKRDFISFG